LGLKSRRLLSPKHEGGKKTKVCATVLMSMWEQWVQAITVPCVPSMSTWESIYRGAKNVIITMPVIRLTTTSWHCMITGSLQSFKIYKCFMPSHWRTDMCPLSGRLHLASLHQLTTSGGDSWPPTMTHGLRQWLAMPPYDLESTEPPVERDLRP
jgi:hypothetical protein